MAVTTKPRENRPGIHPTKLSNYISKQIDALSGLKTQREIAMDLGYERSNIISMFKTGEVKVPLEKLPALARSLNVDLGFLLRLGLEQYMSGELGELSKIFERIVSDNEMQIIRHVRKVSHNTDPHLDEDRQHALAKAFGTK